MRNLKRALSLALAAVMVLGMMVVGAGAAYKDFTDKDEIQHDEAVATLVALNVISGKEDGSYYDPAGSLTRAEMAKLVTYVLNGGKEPVLGTKTTPTYSDIKGHWAESYIEYCSSVGIIAGDGAGKFNPEGTLTGSQAAKMLMVAMGYNAEVFEFVGTNWEINANREANDAKLYNELGGLNPSAVITRDQAAQLVYNAIQAPLMVRSWSQDKTTGNITEIYGLAVENGVTKNSLLIDKFNGAIQLGYLTGYTYDTVKEQWTYTFSSDANFGGAAITSDDKIGASKTLKSTADYTDLFGMQTKVIYKTTVSDVVYGVYAKDSSVVASGVTGDIGTIDATAKTVKVSGTAYKLNSTGIPVYGNNTGVLAGESLATLKDEMKAFSFKLIDNNSDGKADVVIKTPMMVAKITYVGSDSITLGSPVSNTFNVEDISIFDGFAKNDWVYYTAGAYSATGLPTFAEAELKTGTIDAVKGPTGAYTDYQIDGTWYKKSTVDAGNATCGMNDTIEYVVLGGTMYYSKITESGTTSKDLAMVITTGKKTDSAGIDKDAVQAKLIFADGTKKTVTVAKVNGETATYDGTATTDHTTNVTARIGRLVTYRINSDGDYELTDVSSSNLAGYKGAGTTATYNYSDKTVGGKELADDAVVFVYVGTQSTADADNEGKVYTGREIKNAYGDKAISGAAALTAVTDGTTPNATVASLYGVVNGFNYAKVAVINTTAGLTITKGSNYGYLTAGAYNTYENDKTYINFVMWTSSGEVKAKWEDTGALAPYAAGAIITYDNVSDGVIKNVSIVNAITGTVTGWDDVSKIEINGSLSSKVDSVDTTVIYVDSANKKGAEGGTIALGEDTDGIDGADLPNVRYVGNSTVLNLLVVDVKNKMAAGPAIYLNGAQANDAAVETALGSTNNVIVDGTLATDGLALASGKTLTVKGALTATGDITGSGTLVVDDVADATTSGKIKVANVTIKAAITQAELVAISAHSSTVKSITLGAPTSDNVATANAFFATNGTAVNGAVLATGTYTYYAADSIQKADGTTATHSAGWYTAAAVAVVAA